jgi:hypothetical protein
MNGMTQDLEYHMNIVTALEMGDIYDKYSTRSQFWNREV